MNHRSRLETWLVVLIAAHSYAVAIFLMFLTRWGVEFGGWAGLEPLFFARQAGIFHAVVATGYLLEYFRYDGVLLLVFTKTIAVVFLTIMMVVEPGAWSVPLSALGDGLMGVIAFLIHRRTFSNFV